MDKKNLICENKNLRFFISLQKFLANLSSNSFSSLL